MSATGPTSARASWTARILLGILVVLFTVRLVGFAAAFVDESLQMDLASFYAAGQATGRGLSPYVSHVAERPPIWDGVAIFEHSRFLYPPLAARFFQPLTLFPYAVAKGLWTLLSLLAVIGAVTISARVAGLRRALPLLGLAAFVAWFHPLMTLLERGQVDGFVLLAITAALALSMRGGRAELAAGALVALATLFKPHVAYLVPFLALRRQWQAIGGFAAAGALIFLAGLGIDGWGATQDYLTKQLPRIAEHGEGGTRSMALPRESFQPLLQGVERGRTAMDGREYLPAYYRFVLNASLIQTPPLRATGFSPTLLSLLLLGAVAGAAAWCRQRWGDPDTLLFGSIALAAMLLVSPVSWAMGVVLLLPLAALLLGRGVRSGGLPAAAIALGLLLAGAPDPYGFEMLSPFGQGSFDMKYVVAEILCLVGAFGLWRAGDPESVDRAGETS